MNYDNIPNNPNSQSYKDSLNMTPPTPYEEFEIEWWVPDKDGEPVYVTAKGLWDHDERDVRDFTLIDKEGNDVTDLYNTLSVYNDLVLELRYEYKI